MGVVDNNGAPVYVLPASDNRGWIEFVLDLLERLGLGNDFDLMIDASANDFENGGLYCFSRTDGRVFTREEFVEYWLMLSKDYPMALIEDPFAEDDFEAWIRLHGQALNSTLIGDNLCSTDASKIRSASAQHMIGAVLIKPNQAGTVTDAVEAVVAATESGIAPIPSHRSVETDIPWLADLCWAFGLEHAKLGLLSDFETIQKINRLLRYSAGHDPMVST
jgi:enolase